MRMTTDARIPAEAFPPGEIIRDELEARGWTQQDLAQILGRPLMSINLIITGKRSVTPEMAKALGEAFGTGAEFWLNMESAYQLWKVQQVDPGISRRAKLYGYAPINEMVRRHWIDGSNNIDVLEAQVLGFFGVKSLDETPLLAAAALKRASYDGMSIAERAWFARVRQLSQAVQVKPFKAADFTSRLPQLRTLIGKPENVRHVPKILAEWGVRFVAVETLQKLKIDGAAMWLDSDSPVVATSLRYDRLDYFWYVLIHELTHIKHKDASVLDVDIFVDQKSEHGSRTLPPVEVRTNRETVEYLVPSTELDAFIARVRPLYSKQKIIQFANRIRINPGVVVGQLHHRGEVPYSHCREMLAQGQIRKAISETAVVDGWGVIPGPLEARP